MELLQWRELAAEPSEEILHTVLGRGITTLHRRAGPAHPSHTHTLNTHTHPKTRRTNLGSLPFPVKSAFCLNPLFLSRQANLFTGVCEGAFVCATHICVCTHTRINLQATSQLTPAEYNTNPHRLSPADTQSFFFSLFFSSHVPIRIRMCTCVCMQHATTCIFCRKRGDGASDQQSTYSR